MVKNISAVEWLAVGETDGRYAMKLAARWRPKNGTVTGENSFMKNLTHDVEPGDTVGLSLEVPAPTQSGEYWLEVDLMQEGVGWSPIMAREPLRLGVVVE